MKKLEVVLEDSDLEQAVRALCGAVRFASGDGRILVYDIADVIPLNRDGVAYLEEPFDVDQFLRSQRG